MIKKESRQFNISVEGLNCEKMYFEHLAKLINSSDSTYDLKVAPRKMSPIQYARRNAYKPVAKRKDNKKLPYIHVQDIEDYYSEFHKNKFFGMIDEMREAEREFGISYELGYSNYTFELWILLHVADMDYSVQDRKAYLSPINRWFHRDFADLDEFKQEAAFQEILDEFVTLDSIRHAIRRAEKIVEQNAQDRKASENYRGLTFYHDNPDVSVHEAVQLIFEVCEVK